MLYFPAMGIINITLFAKIFLGSGMVTKNNPMSGVIYYP
jgi:hypothetical protein